jgi:hypothetical protein
LEENNKNLLEEKKDYFKKIKDNFSNEESDLE